MGLELRTGMCSRSQGYVMRPALSVYYVSGVFPLCAVSGVFHAGHAQLLRKKAIDLTLISVLIS